MKNFCQSCAMPMDEAGDLYGSNENGSKNEDYCQYCFKDGKFTNDVTMKEMIEICVPFMTEANKEMTADMARGQMKEFFPKLKRWAK